MKLIEAVEQIKGRKVLVIGDVELDKFTTGKANKISPEAPVPIVEVESEGYILGATANIINNIRALGGEVWLVTVIGDDPEGECLMGKLKELNVNVDGVFRDKERITTLVHRIVTGGQQLLRLDRNKSQKISHEMAENIINYVSEIIVGLDITVLSDYGRGVVTHEVIKGVTGYSRQHNKKIVVNPKKENFWNYEGASLIRTNKLEASYATGITPINETSVRNMGQKILTVLGCKATLITWIEEGSYLFEQSGKIAFIPPLIKRPINTIGVGDAITSALALATAAGLTFEDSSRIANFAGAIAASKEGVSKVPLEELREAIKEGKVTT